jgi:hypothetical protein
MNDVKVQPLFSDCQISEAGPSVAESPPPDGHIRHTQISPYVLYKMPPAQPVYPWCACHHVQRSPTQNIVHTVMLGVLVTNMDHILEVDFPQALTGTGGHLL